MSIAECNTTTDCTGKELLQHGTVAFPIACYHDDFQKMDVPWHWHEELEAVFVTEGSCIVAAGSEKITVQAGAGFFINSGILHGAWDVAATGCRFHSMVFHPRLVGGSLDSVFYQRYMNPLLNHPAMKLIHLSPNVPWQRAALAEIESAWQACSSESAGYEFCIRNALSQFIWLLHSHSPEFGCQISEKNLRDAERIKTMLSFIHERFGEELNTKVIAASCMISESECLRCFHSTIGTTPIQYLRQYRIQQAAEQLVMTPDKISDIAARCGFQDISYFTKTFRELKGCTPTEYRTKG